MILKRELRMSNQAWAITGLVAGIGYYAISESNQAENNRSYTAAPLTDVLAFLGAGYITWKGWTLNQGKLVGIGTTIFSIHLMQVLFHKGWDTYRKI